MINHDEEDKRSFAKRMSAKGENKMGWLIFLAGAVIGDFLGLLTAALCIIARKGDDYAARLQDKQNDIEVDNPTRTKTDL